MTASGVRGVDLFQIAGRSHLFEEPGALEQVAYLARARFELYLPI